ncbi:MAG: hypothetical protein ABIZ04_14835 [Opitutus sp.]
MSSPLGALVAGPRLVAAVGKAGPETISKIFARRRVGGSHLRQLLEAARAIVGAALATAASGPALSVRTLEQTDEAAIEAWENEGNPN